MGKFDVTKFESINQKWNTPKEVFEPMNEEFNFIFDLASDEENKLCNRNFTEKDNALEKDWSKIGVGWLNPPFGDKRFPVRKWVKKAYDETMNSNSIVVMLLLVKSNTKWWAEYCMNSKEVKYIIGRPKFTGNKYGLPFPLALVVFGKHDGETKYSKLDITQKDNHKT